MALVIVKREATYDIDGLPLISEGVKITHVGANAIVNETMKSYEIGNSRFNVLLSLQSKGKQSMGTSSIRKHLTVSYTHTHHCLAQNNISYSPINQRRRQQAQSISIRLYVTYSTAI